MSRGWSAAGRAVAVSGAASGIGRALCLALTRAGAHSVLCLDLDEHGAEATTDGLRQARPDIQAQATCCDVSNRASLQAALRAAGRVDGFFANAGIATPGDCSTAIDEWEKTIAVNTMQIVHAADVLVPPMLERGGGAFVVTASAAGLLTQLGSAPYTMTKHAAVGLAEWLAVSYGDAGLNVCCVCPQGVRTPMITGADDGDLLASAAGIDGLLEPEDVANDALRCLEEGGT